MSKVSTPQETRNVARRAMEICNACRYCESLCPVFPEITRFRTFSDQDLNYFANLCHNCKGCFHGCQYAPPHEFDLNIPKLFSEIRVETYSQYAFPSFFGKLFFKNGTLLSVVIALSIALVLMAGIAFNNAPSLFVAYTGEGSFYQVIPIKWMSGISMLVSLFIFVAFYMGFKKFWTQSGEQMRDLGNVALWKSALSDMMTLRHLGGGDEGHGCTHVDDRYSQSRKWFHHATFYGFAMTIVSTTIAAVYHYGFGWHAPYAMSSLPVVFGTIGGFMILVGTVGLGVIKLKMDPVPVAHQFLGMEYSFITLLFLVSLTGLALLFFREGVYMPILLCLHLGCVLAFFLVLPYSKFVHALYRFGALLKYAKYKDHAPIFE